MAKTTDKKDTKKVVKKTTTTNKAKKEETKTTKTTKATKATKAAKATEETKVKTKDVPEVVEKEVVEVVEKVDEQQEVELTVKENLSALYKLQRVDSKIDKIQIIKGELPLEVQDLEDEVEGLSTRIENYIHEIDTCEKEIKSKKNDTKERFVLVKRYEEQLNNVRNNREYDALQKEIEFQGLEVQLNDKKIKEFEAKIASNKDAIEKFQSQLGELQSELEIKQTELKDIVAETEIEEKELREISEKQKAKIDERLVFAYQRIRNAARNGLAVVPVERNSCGGCFSTIPPQRQLDIRSHKKIIVCEFCGRILIDSELVGEIDE
ncbi:MAG: C4-type zinc ribbon domain-containing protein [Lentimicrobiaceae bacterium]|nr:C4-type zinc ribbon domain-containing protein [Lentimicrobiaceae bacterium]